MSCPLLIQNGMGEQEDKTLGSGKEIKKEKKKKISIVVPTEAESSSENS